MRIRISVLAALLVCLVVAMPQAAQADEPPPGTAAACDPGQFGQFCEIFGNCPPGQFGNPCQPLPEQCPAGQTGAPPNCTPAPATCPAGQTGTPPNCTTPTACPAGQTGTPPKCETPPATCPAGQTGAPPNCRTPAPARCAAGQTGTPPNCRAAATTAATCAAGQTGRPPNCVTPATPCPEGDTGTPPNCVSPAPASGAGEQGDRILRRTINLGRGCSRPLLAVSGGSVKVAFAKRLGRLRCRLTLRVGPAATGGRRDLLARRGTKIVRFKKIIRI